MKRQSLWLLLLMGLTGCLGGTRPAPIIKQYVLEYPPPRVEQASPIQASLRVERFSAARLYAGPEMIFRQGAFQQEAYRAQRWRVSPPDMVADLLRRDLRNAGLFRAVLTARDREDPRFDLEGAVDEFIELDGPPPQGRKAKLALTLTFLDLTRREIPERVVYQKAYRCEAACTQEGAAGFAEAMSRAMSQCSEQMVADIDAALKSRR